MEFQKCIKESFVVIGKEGSTHDGKDFIQELWNDANTNFHEVAHLAKTDEEGNILGIWGAMSDLSRSFNPWEDDFSKGLYLAGVECKDDAIAPENWTKWVVPSYEYVFVENDSKEAFSNAIRYLKQNNLTLVGAVHDFNCPETKNAYIFLPIRKL